ncbi:hypothetical protein EI555_013256, partial [Monodon monoceros]
GVPGNRVGPMTSQRGHRAPRCPWGREPETLTMNFDQKAGEIPGKFSHQWRRTLDPWRPEAEATCDFPVTSQGAGRAGGRAAGVGWLLAGGMAGLGRQAGWWRPAWRTQAQSLLPARAGATPSRRDRSGRPGPHQVPGARCFSVRVLPTAPLFTIGSHAPHPWRAPSPKAPTVRPHPRSGTPATSAPMTLPPPQRGVADRVVPERKPRHPERLQPGAGLPGGSWGGGGGGAPEGGACGDFDLQWPSPADYQPPGPPACLAFSFGGRLAPGPPEAQAHLGMLQAWGPSVDGVSSIAYDILPGCRLPGPCPPAFCVSRSPLLASWVGSCKEPAPWARLPMAWRTATTLTSPPHTGVVIQGLRRPKCHDTGPFCALSSPVGASPAACGGSCLCTNFPRGPPCVTQALGQAPFSVSSKLNPFKQSPPKSCSRGVGVIPFRREAEDK